VLREELREARDLIVQLQRELERAYEVLAAFRAQQEEGRCAHV
jgi:hypothetical protein